MKQQDATTRSSSLSPKKQSGKKKRFNNNRSNFSPRNRNKHKAKNSLVSSIESLTALTSCTPHTNESISALLQEMQSTSQTLVTTFKSHKQHTRDSRIKDCFLLIFQAVNIVQSTSIPHKDMILKQLEMWNSLGEILQSILLDENTTKYIPKKASILKLTEEEAKYTFPIILITIQNDVKSLNLVNFTCLACFIQAFGHQLPVEDMKQCIIILIEILEKGNVDATRDILLEIQVHCIHCVVRIMRWKQLSVELLKIGIESKDQDWNDGDGMTTVASRLVNAIVDIINLDEYLKLKDTTWLCHMCECLTAILETMDHLEKNTPKDVYSNAEVMNAPHVIDPTQIANIYKWVYKTLQCDIHQSTTNTNDTDATSTKEQERPKEMSLWWYSLGLLRTIVKHHPKVCGQYWSLFFPKQKSWPSIQSMSSSPMRKTVAGIKNHVNLISILVMEDDIDKGILLSDERCIAAICCKEILDALPFHLWSKSGYLSGRIESSLAEIISTTKTQLTKQSKEQEKEALYSLATTIVTKIPYEKYTVLEKSAVVLVDQLGKNYCMFGLHGGLGLEVVVESIAECMGCKELPTGEITPLPYPTGKWIESRQSGMFMSQIFMKMSDMASHDIIEKGPQTIVQMKLFVKVIRCATWILVDQSRSQAFVDLVNVLVTSDDNLLKGISAELLSAFLTGKRTCSTKQVKEINLPMSLFETLASSFESKDISLRRSIPSTFALLDFASWMRLLDGPNNPLDKIKQMALEYSGDSNASVRSEACKALGHIMTTFMHGNSTLTLGSPTRGVLHKNVNDTINVAMVAIDDTNGTVRSMALFAIGNIAYETAKFEEWSFIELLPIFPLLASTFNRLSDENEKVVNNAIRTSKHIFHLANYELRKQERIQNESNWCKITEYYLANFEAKIDRAILDVIEVSDTRTWKQRMNAKKQAWGACQACQILLHFSTSFSSIEMVVVENTLLKLVECIQYALKTNEKITSAAVSTLGSVPVEVWRSLPDDCIVRGACLSACLVKVELANLSNEIKTGLQDVIRRVLILFDDNDTKSFLEKGDITQVNLEYLYEFMVENSMAANQFESFARVLSEFNSDFDVSIIQKFHSRAIFEARVRNKSLGSLSEVQNYIEDSDEDEL